IPATTPPSCSTRIGEIARDVKLRVDGYGSTCSIPITIGEYGRRAEGEGAPMPPGRLDRNLSTKGHNPWIRYDARRVRANVLALRPIAHRASTEVRDGSRSPARRARG